MAYADLSGVHDPAAGLIAPSAWGDQVNDNSAFLAARPSCRVGKLAAQSIPNAADTAITFDTEVWDTDAMHSTVTNTTRITATTAGRYLVGGHVEFAANATGSRRLFIHHQSTTVLANTLNGNAGAAQPAWLSVVGLVVLAVGEYVDLVVRQTSGGALNVTLQANWSPEFWAVMLSR